ncbi:CENP-B-like protein 1 [Zalerion maritima]|uniref:CENP-B-like protein 1 n=1 Tax=Zalerion maritima TaxID=339359 RepID=A0AAD5RKX0_9PEZI|nr:CENP-B-like protein 1 [Zalerion maritima]
MNASMLRSISEPVGGCGAQLSNSQICGNPKAILWFKNIDQCRRSPHCKTHGCRFVNSSGACTYVAMNGFHFCKRHLQCKAHDDNGRRCRELVSKDDPNNYKFCSKYHICRLEECTSKRVQSCPGGEDLKYCVAHKCEGASCSRLKNASRRSRWCLEHTCGDEFCTANVDENDKFCPTHAKCKLDGCNKPTHARPGEDAGPYCSTHYCRWFGCGNERVNNRGSGAMSALNFCETHICKMGDCKEPRVGTQSMPSSGIWAGDEAEYCAKHECEHEGCTASKANESKWCNDHQCLERNCHRGCWSNKQYCQKHVRCKEGCCDRRVIRIRGKPQDYCDERTYCLRDTLSSPTYPLEIQEPHSELEGDDSTYTSPRKMHTELEGDMMGSRHSSRRSKGNYTLKNDATPQGNYTLRDDMSRPNYTFKEDIPRRSAPQGNFSWKKPPGHIGPNDDDQYSSSSSPSSYSHHHCHHHTARRPRTPPPSGFGFGSYPTPQKDHDWWSLRAFAPRHQGLKPQGHIPSLREDILSSPFTHYSSPPYPPRRGNFSWEKSDSPRATSYDGRSSNPRVELTGGGVRIDLDERDGEDVNIYVSDVDDQENVNIQFVDHPGFIPVHRRFGKGAPRIPEMPWAVGEQAFPHFDT